MKIQWMFLRVLFLIVGSTLAILATDRYVDAQQNNSPRFEKLTSQTNDRHLNEAEVFEVWHDKVSGQEFTCAFGQPGEFAERAPSCFPTGRKW